MATDEQASALDDQAVTGVESVRAADGREVRYGKTLDKLQAAELIRAHNLRTSTVPMMRTTKTAFSRD
jgi:hypothetical protein